jgi:hypothetical protein
MQQPRSSRIKQIMRLARQKGTKQAKAIGKKKFGEICEMAGLFGEMK